jgi:hypothetical protein
MSHRLSHGELSRFKTYVAKLIRGLGDFDVRHHEQGRLDSFFARNMVKAAHS